MRYDSQLTVLRSEYSERQEALKKTREAFESEQKKMEEELQIEYSKVAALTHLSGLDRRFSLLRLPLHMIRLLLSKHPSICWSHRK